VSAGDHALTGLAIGKMLGIAGNGSVVTGPELDAMTDEQLKLVSSRSRSCWDPSGRVLQIAQLHTCTGLVHDTCYAVLPYFPAP
jgi:hypothetical protein